MDVKILAKEEIATAIHESCPSYLDKVVALDMAQVVIDALSAAGRTIEADWNTDMEAAPRDGARVRGLTEYGEEMVRYREERYSPDVMSASAKVWKAGWWGTEQDSKCCPETHWAGTGKITPAKHQPTAWKPLNPPGEG